MLDIKVWGDYACFTRPEFKVERVSYPVMTPAAARGILEAIYWKPQIYYRIQRIGILNIGTHSSLLRNEISSRQKERSEYLVAEEERQQRTSLILQGADCEGEYRPLAYRIQACVVLRNGENNLAKHQDCFRRRAKHGQYHHKPCLGCREFPADFEPINGTEAGPSSSLCLPIGTMLFDTAYIENTTWYEAHEEDRLEFWRHDADGTSRIVKGYARRLFFVAKVKEGWLKIPQDKYEELDRLEGRHGTA